MKLRRGNHSDKRRDSESVHQKQTARLRAIIEREVIEANKVRLYVAAGIGAVLGICVYILITSVIL